MSDASDEATGAVSEAAGGAGAVQVRRIYDAPSADDGQRVLVDRLWPRGVSKERADLDAWLPQVAPSTQLREWYHHDPARFAEFSRRYREELDDPSVPEREQAYAELVDRARRGRLTLLTASKRADISEATVLAERLDRSLAASAAPQKKG